MFKTIIHIFKQSKFLGFESLIFGVIFLYLNLILHANPLNFTILLTILFVASYLSFIMCMELYYQEEENNVYKYLKILKPENEVALYRVKTIYLVSSTAAVVIAIVLNIIYIDKTLLFIQMIYLVLILIWNFFYIHFLQYMYIYINNGLLRNSIMICVSIISIIALMTKSLTTFVVIIIILSQFFAVTFMNRQIGNDIVNEEK